MAKEKDIVDELLGGGEKNKEEKPHKQGKQVIDPEKEKEKREEVAFESPQDRFRRIIKDQGYRTGVENLLSVFFDGDTNSPKWLDEVLMMGNIPAKNRELIVTTYYGKTLSELGITISPADRTKGGMQVSLDKTIGVDGKKIDGSDDISIFADDMMKEQLKSAKTRLALAQINKMTEEMEKSRTPQQQIQQPSVQVTSMRQITRPILKDGQMLKDGNGNVIYETINEPVTQTSSSGGNDILTMITAIKALEGDKKSSSSPEIVEALKTMGEKLVSIEKNSEIQRQEDRIKRLEEEKQRIADDFKKDIQKKDDDFRYRLDEMNKERLRDMESLKERFTSEINHRKELDNLIGQVSSDHKKEMDEVKKRLEHAQTSIERTVVAKGTDTVDKLTGKVADLTDSVIKPMVGVMKDHYQLTIDTQRKQLGLPTLKESIPSVNDEELANFAKG